MRISYQSKMQHVTVPRFTSIDIRLVDGAAIRIGIEDELIRSLIDKPKDYQKLVNSKCDPEEESGKIEGGFEIPPSIICNSISVSGGGVLSEDIPEIENELVDLFDQLETEDFVYNQSQPLKIDPNILKLDFSNLTTGRTLSDNNYKPLEQFSFKSDPENRASHHLSGGGLLTDTSQDTTFQNGQFCGYRYNEFTPVSPSSPFTFDLLPRSPDVQSVTNNRISPEVESTNPFKNFMKDVLEEENPFSSTNPFSDMSISSPTEIPNINCIPSRCEEASTPRKSFSQCSTRPASPISRSNEESFILNPFLLNRASPEPRPSVSVPHFFINDRNFQSPSTPLPNQSPFIFAVPVMPIFQHSITSCSTQTQTAEEIDPKPIEPVYQNITHQLRKYMQKNDHSEYDLKCLKRTVKDLRTSGWYYENVSWQESVVLLRNTEPGTFLIRDSSDPNFLFSLSVQTSRGPTSVRLHYVNGQFRLDAEEKLIPHIPAFNSVVELVDYYIENTVKNKLANQCSKKNVKKNGKAQKSKEQVWIDSQGNIYSNILLVKPLYKKEHFSTLQHLARLAINRHIKKRMNTKVKVNFRVTPVYESSPFQECSFPNSFDNFCPILSLDTLPLPTTLIEYLKDYPYCH